MPCYWSQTGLYWDLHHRHRNAIILKELVSVLEYLKYLSWIFYGYIWNIWIYMELAYKTRKKVAFMLAKIGGGTDQNKNKLKKD